MFKLSMKVQRAKQKGELNYTRLGSEEFKLRPVTTLLVPG